jgi:hypothetical protein
MKVVRKTVTRRNYMRCFYLFSHDMFRPIQWPSSGDSYIYIYINMRRSCYSYNGSIVYSVSIIVYVACKYCCCCCLVLNFKLNFKMAVKILKLYNIFNRRVALNHSMFHCLQILGASCLPLVFSVACRMDDDLQWCFRASRVLGIYLFIFMSPCSVPIFCLVFFDSAEWAAPFVCI